MARHEYPSGVPWLLFALLFAGTAGKGLYRPVGLGATANLGIPDSSFTASGQSDDQTGPEQARLYSASYGGGWVAADSNLDNTDQWLQIDLLNPQLVVKIETQGRSRAQHWTTHYKLLYSNVTTNWTVYQTGGADRIFEGNTDRYKVRETVLDPPFHARYVRFNPWGWYRKAALRVELFVCRGPSCLNPALPSGDIVPVGIGMRSSLGIADHRMTCSGHLDPQPTGSEAEAQKAMDEGECPIELKRELEAQRQRMAAEAAEAEAKAAAASNDSPSNATEDLVPKLAVPLLRDEKCDQRYVAHQGRLYNTAGGGGWAPDEAREGTWLQVDMGKDYYVKGIVTQGREFADQYVTEYYVSTKASDALMAETYSDAGGRPLFLTANTDHRQPHTNWLDKAPLAQYVKIHPTKWKAYPTLRVEILVCPGSAVDCEPQPVGVGARSHQSVRDADIKASSALKFFAEHHGRLETTAGGGGWIPDHYNNPDGHFLQVDMKDLLYIGEVATQGILHKNTWTTTYKIAYATHPAEWTDYKEDGQVKVFEGNRNQNTVVRNTFTRPFSARYVRIYPLTWSWVPGLRWELYEVMEESHTFSSVEPLKMPGDSMGMDF
jgi:hypothetical protein